MTKRLIEYSILEVNELTLEELRAVDVKAELAQFTAKEDNMDLLKAIKDRVLMLSKWNHPLHVKIKNRLNYLTSSGRLSPDETDDFGDEYCPDKYETHEPSSVKFHMTVLEVKGGLVIRRVDPPKGGSSDLVVGDEEGLIVATYKQVNELTNREKNDIIAIMGRSFGRVKVEGFFCHDTATVTHELLQKSHHTTRVVLVQYVPKVADGNTQMMHTVCAAVFSPMQVKRHEKDDKIVTMRTNTINAVNLVQIGVVAEWGGRNLGGITLEHIIQARLRDAGYDLVIICGCARKFYLKLNVSCNPAWLESSPFNLLMPKDEDESSDASFTAEELEEYNRKLFFYVALDGKKYKKNITDPAEKGRKFSFEFKSEYLKGYYGVGEEEADDEGADENVSPNAD